MASMPGNTNLQGRLRGLKKPHFTIFMELKHFLEQYLPKSVRQYHQTWLEDYKKSNLRAAKWQSWIKCPSLILEIQVVISAQPENIFLFSLCYI